MGVRELIPHGEYIPHDLWFKAPQPKHRPSHPPLILSPHFDDAPLSLGQSMIDGELSGTVPTVGIIFGRTNWQQWVYPTRRRAPVVRVIREAEERFNARRFGYRLKIGSLEEVILRTGESDSATFLDPTVALDPTLIEAVASTIRPWVDAASVVLAPLGIGGHLDHRLVHAAAQQVVPADRLSFYEDRPYASVIDDSHIDAFVAALDPRLTSRDASATIGPVKTRRVWYASQFDPFFLDAMAADVIGRRCERLWSRPLQTADDTVRSES